MAKTVKMSTLMRRGAARLSPTTELHYELDSGGNVVGACAIGCMMVELGLHENPIPQVNFLPSYLYDVLDINFRKRDLPEDVQHLFRDNAKYVFYFIIAEVNDKVSRDRAINLVREMGY